MPTSTSRTALAAAIVLALGASVSATAAAPVLAAQATPDVVAAAAGNPSLIILRAGVFDPAAERLELAATGVDRAVPSSHAIVQLRPGAIGAREALRATGIEFLGYVPNNAYYVRLNGASLDELARHAAVRWAGFVTPGMKLDPRLWRNARATSDARQWNGRYEVRIEGFRGESSAQIANALRKAVPAATITRRSERAEAAPYVRAAVAPDQFDALLLAASAIDGVAFISPWIQPEPMNSGAIGAIQGNDTGACGGSGTVCGPTPLWDHGLFGSGQIVAISDTGLDANEAWFTTFDSGAGPHTEVTLADDPAPIPPALGILHPDNKVIGYWTQPGATAYDNNNQCSPSSPPSSFHGSHTSGTIAGDAAGTFGADTYAASTPGAANHDLSDGMAPNAQLLAQDIGNDPAGCLAINDFGGTLRQAVAADAHIHSNSWGSADQGSYNSNDSEVDHATWETESLLVVVSAGNDGPGAGTTGSPGNAKNSLTIGALGHAGSTSVVSFSSRGPTADGRLKPDIMAPGSSTISTSGDATSTTAIEPPLSKSLSGTSMSAPTISGNAALLRQYFVDGFYPRGFQNLQASGDFIFTDGFDGTAPPTDLVPVDTYNPSGMVMKAVLLNGTNTLQSNWPNNNIGWGRAWLDGNLWFQDTMPGGDDSRRLRIFERTNAAGLRTGESNAYTIHNVEQGVELRATLTWYDPEAAPGALLTLVNNLDLEVVGPDSTVYKGNVWNGSGDSATGGAADAVNTVEMVRFTAPLAGEYTFRVTGTAVPGNGRPETDRQGYALVVSGGFGLPDTAPLAAPTNVEVSANGGGGVSIDFDPVAGAQGYQLYRADGSCGSAEAGDFRLVGSASGGSALDSTSQGGYQYAYKVRGVQNDVEGEASGCVSLVSADECSLLPIFDTHSVSADGSNSSCSVDLAWQAATSSCPASADISYTILRDTDPYFGSPDVIASDVSATTFSDTDVADGVPHYYRVVAVDGSGNASPPSQTINVTPTGVDGPDPGAFSDNVETHTYMTMQPPWQITNSESSDGSFSYHNAQDDANYPDLTCASITMPPLTLTAGAVLDFMARYDIEYQWDGVVMEISTDGGTSWVDLPPDGGYPGSFAQTLDPPINACGFTASHGAFNGVTTAGSNADPGNGSATAIFKPFSVDLSAYFGQTVRIRWRMSSDPGASFEGFFLDQVQVTGAPGGGSYTCN
jgi:hypothetical protein